MVNTSLPTTRADVPRSLTGGRHLHRIDWDWAQGEHTRALKNRDRFEREHLEVGDERMSSYHSVISLCLRSEELDLERRMVATPAPDLAALGAKLEAVFRPENDGRQWRCEEREAVLADIRRLIPNRGRAHLALKSKRRDAVKCGVPSVPGVQGRKNSE